MYALFHVKRYIILFRTLIFAQFSLFLEMIFHFVFQDWGKGDTATYDDITRCHGNNHDSIYELSVIYIEGTKV